MKKIHYLILALVCSVFTGCMDGDWDEPATRDTLYGNSDIKETNVITVKDLKTKFKNEISTLGNYKEITEDMQLKVVVTANDIEGNMYNEICVQDETGGIFIGISQGGVFGYLPVGTEILIDLKGLYIGNYRRSATIGTPYTSKEGDEVSVSRMPRALWQQHFTYTGYRMHVTPELFADGSTPTTWDLTMDAGKLGTLKNVTIKKGGYYDSNGGPSGTGEYVDVTFVPGESTFVVPGFSTSWYFNEQISDSRNGLAVQIYTSSYADFAAMKLPTGKVNVTGVLKHYCNKSGGNESWEIIMRSLDDIEEVK